MKQKHCPKCKKFLFLEDFYRDRTKVDGRESACKTCKKLEKQKYHTKHIDHIKPLSIFDLTDREQFLEACHYSNLQPLWAKDNISKGAKYDS